jgi:hypothetical protein
VCRGISKELSNLVTSFKKTNKPNSFILSTYPTYPAYIHSLPKGLKYRGDDKNNIMMLRNNKCIIMSDNIIMMMGWYVMKVMIKRYMIP